MQKISITAPKSELRKAIDEIHNLGLLDIEAYDGDLDKGSPFKESDQLSTKLVNVRSILSKLPKTNSSAKKDVDRTLQALEVVQKDVNELENEKSEIEAEISALKNELKYFNKLEGIGLNNEDLSGSRNLEIILGEFDQDKLKEVEEEIEQNHGEKVSAVIFEKDDEKTLKTINSAIKDRLNRKYGEREGKIEEIIKKINEEIEEKNKELEDVDSELKKIANDWRPSLEETEEFLKMKVEKTEAPLHFAATERAFIAQGWIPKSKFENLNSVLEDKLKAFHIEEIEGENPPVKHNNNRVVAPFESLTDLMSRPKYGEVDPSFMLLLTFPLFFGMMIGDVGYGLTSGLVFLGGMKFFPKARSLFKALLWTSLATIIFGFIYGEAFGFHFLKTPYYRADLWTEIFYGSILIGAAHVNLGILIGAYNEYSAHGLKEATFEKGSWFMLQLAAVAWYFTSAQVGGPLMALSLLALYKGEGAVGIVEIPSLISNILSYLRLFGVCMAAYTLAQTVNTIATPMLASGTLMGIAGGTIIMIGGHTMLTFVKILEGFLQGIRLHYVEQFNWFYEGGGRKYNPFGGNS